MPRTARIKDNNGIYHIMIRSISEVQLFKCNADRDKFLELLAKYQKLYLFKIYGFCLLGSHAHFIIASNGADISKFMKSINQSYAFYYNKKYNRHGHLFQDRFKSKLVPSYSYLLTLSAYIHNNAKDIPNYSKRIEKYAYSSLKTYLNVSNNPLGLVDVSYILNLFDDNFNEAKHNYFELLKHYLENKKGTLSDNLDFKNEHTKYISGKNMITRNYSPEDIISFINQYTNGLNIHLKYYHANTERRAITVFLLKAFCDYSNIDIANYIGNITTSQISKLCSKALIIIQNNPTYHGIIDDFISYINPEKNA